jgi:hypothetical protein
VDKLEQAEEDVVLDLDSDEGEEEAFKDAVDPTSRRDATSPASAPSVSAGVFESDSAEAAGFAAEVSQGIPDGALDAVLRDEAQAAALWWYVNVAAQVTALVVLIASW